MARWLSTYVGTKPTTTKRRFCRKEKEYKDIPCPKAIELYNEHMGGVDLLDSMLGLYRIHLRSKKWYKRIFFHMVDKCIVNAWLLWRRKPHNEYYMPLFDFKQSIAEHLCKAGKSLSRKRGRPTNSQNQTGTPTSSRQGKSTCSVKLTNDCPRNEKKNSCKAPRSASTLSSS